MTDLVNNGKNSRIVLLFSADFEKVVVRQNGGATQETQEAIEDAVREYDSATEENAIHLFDEEVIDVWSREAIASLEHELSVDHTLEIEIPPSCCISRMIPLLSLKVREKISIVQIARGKKEVIVEAKVSEA